MHLESVGEHVKMSLPEIRQTMADLAMAGVLSEIYGGALAVQPRQLRSALIRAVFFPDQLPRLQYRELLERAPSRESAVEALLEAQARGALIPPGELRQLVLQSGSRRNWAGIAQLNEKAAQWVLDTYPGDVLDVAAGALGQAPRATIPRILKRAEEELGTSDTRPDDPMSFLTRWLMAIGVSPQEGLERRRLIARAAKKYLREGGNLSVGTQGIFLSLRPSVQGSTIDPGIGDTVTLRFGLLPLESLPGIRAIWEEVRDAIVEIDRSSWQHISAALWNWIHPEYAAKGAQVADEKKHAMRAFAAQMLRELSPLAEGKPGVAAGLRGLAARIGVDLPVASDPVFDLLYPEETSEEQPLKAIAALWAQQPPASVATKLASYEQEAETIGREWFLTVPEFCRILAAAVDEPEAWLDAFLDLDRDGHFSAPFLEQIVKGARSEWELQVGRCLELKALKWSATSLVLQHPNPPEPLLRRAIEIAAALPTLVETLCLRREVPIPTLRLLLRLPQWETAAAAAIGEWQSDPAKTVRQEVAPEWRAAILRAETKDYRNASEAVGIQYWLGEILAKDAELALRWLQARLGDSDLPSHFMGDSPFVRALRGLSHAQRIELLESLDPSPILGSLLPLLIGHDLGLYEKLLAIERLKDYHLEPLKGCPDETWIGLAEQARKR